MCFIDELTPARRAKFEASLRGAMEAIVSEPSRAALYYNELMVELTTTRAIFDSSDIANSITTDPDLKNIHYEALASHIRQVLKGVDIGGNTRYSLAEDSADKRYNADRSPPAGWNR